MTTLVIRTAEPQDVPALNRALAALSADMGDIHRATDQDLLEAGFGVSPAFAALLAESGQELVGVAVFSPLYSTTRGHAGAYVSDLWVASSMRGQQLGPKLLAAVRDHARRDWGAGFIRLGVYAGNGRARAFYDRLGFELLTEATFLTLAGKALDRAGGG